MTQKVLLLLPVLIFVFGVQYSYAEPFEEMSISILEYDETESSAKIQLDWISDDSVSKYEVGCVSCLPNTIEDSISSHIMLENITPFRNSSTVMLYILAYDLEDNVIKAKQIILNIGP